MGEDNIPKAITPTYAMQSPNEPVVLFNGPLEIDMGNGTETVEGMVYFEWLPKPFVAVRFVTTSSHLEFITGPITVTIPRIERTIKAVIAEYHGKRVREEKADSQQHFVDRTELTLASLDSISKGEPSGFSSVVFHVVNFRNFSGQGACIRTEDYFATVNRMILADEDWRITIDTSDRIRELVTSLGRAGGHAITCIGKLERCNGTTFGLEELGEAVKFLNCFLSFTNGSRCSIVLPIAFDAGGVEVWRGWYACPNARWQGKPNWSEDWPAKFVAEAFPGFMKRWVNPIWREPIEIAVEWYLQSQRGTVETALLLTQATLELFAWVQFVEDEKVIVGTEAFEKMYASDRIRLLLNKHSIELDIPGMLTALLAVKINNKTFHDGPHAITEIRNSIVHPKKSKRQQIASVRLAKDQAARLGLWYVENMLLKLFGYPYEPSATTLAYPTRDGA